MRNEKIAITSESICQYRNISTVAVLLQLKQHMKQQYKAEMTSTTIFFFWNLGKKDSSQCYNINTLIQAPIWLNPNKNCICYMIKMLMYIYSLCKTWSSCNRAPSYQRYPIMDSLSLMPLHFFGCCPTMSVYNFLLWLMLVFELWS